MNITLVYDNESRTDNLRADWGFACVVSHNGTNLLFDTGSDGELLLANMQALGIDPQSIDDVFISHSHFDHSGGLSLFLNRNRDVTVYAPKALSGIRPAHKVVYMEDTPFEFREGFYSTGLLDNIEQSLAVRTEQGVAVIVGCSHPGVGKILNAVQPFGSPDLLIGGLHGFDDFDILEPLEKICPTHCTHHIDNIRTRYPDKYIQGGAGVTIKL